jgi:hypothetical protein
MAGRMAEDVWDGKVRDTSDYLAVWGQNIVGGIEIGASIDLTLASGGIFAMAGGGALGSAGFDALTFGGQAQGAKEFAVNQVVEGGKGAVFGAGFGVVAKGATALVGAALPLAEAVSSTAGAQMVKRGAQAAIGKLAQTEAGQAAAQLASAATKKLTSAGAAIAGGVRAMGAQADDVARQVGLGEAAKAPAAAGRWLSQQEGKVGEVLSQAWREASTPWTGYKPTPVGTPYFERFGGMDRVAQTTGADADIVSRAAAWQGQGAYPGVDAWGAFSLRKGDMIVGGYPGPSAFFTEEGTLLAAGYQREAVRQALQIELSPIRPPRAWARYYRVKTDARVAMSKVAANKAHGPGGAIQYYVEDWQNVLEPLINQPLK